MKLHYKTKPALLLLKEALERERPTDAHLLTAKVSELTLDVARHAKECLVKLRALFPTGDAPAPYTKRASTCYLKADDAEPIFVLRGQDLLAPAHVRDWAEHAELRGVDPEKVADARACAAAMEAWPTRKVPT